MSKKTILCIAILLANTVYSSYVLADDIIVTTAPPAPRVETVPAPRTGYVWAPGYWKWEGNEHVWVDGHWVEARVHSHWVPDTWAQEDSTHWHFIAGHWEND